MHLLVTLFHYRDFSTHHPIVYQCLKIAIIRLLTWKTKDVLRTYQTLGNFYVLILLFLKNYSK